MKRRLRKKKRVGEYREFCFGAGFRLSGGLSVEARKKFLERFIEEAIEANGFVFGGGGSDLGWDGVVSSDKIRCSSTDAHREIIKKWFITRTEITKYYVSPLTDAWYVNDNYDDDENIEWIEK